MNNQLNQDEWAEEFKLFLDASEIKPPDELSRTILRRVASDLKPPLWVVTGKLAGIHVICGSISLLICTQFGMGRGYNLMQIFVRSNVFECMALCGAAFLILTNIMAGTLLSKEELKKIRRAGYAPVLTLGVVSLLIFFFFGAELTLNLALFWLLGAAIAGISAMELSLGLRALLDWM